MNRQLPLSLSRLSATRVTLTLTQQPALHRTQAMHLPSATTTAAAEAVASGLKATAATNPVDGGRTHVVVVGVGVGVVVVDTTSTGVAVAVATANAR